MVWKNLNRVLEDYSMYMHNAVLKNLPTNYAIRDNIKVVVNIEDNRWYEVEFRAPEYWYYIENGRKAGKMPPIKAIEEWITRRNIVPYALKNGKLPTTKQLAYVIARKIGNEGTTVTPNFFLSRSQEEVEAQFKESISEAIGKDISEEIHLFLEPAFGNVKTINL